MKYSEILNEYIEALGCMQKELAEAAGISPAALSRYRSGVRVPDKNSTTFRSICTAISRMAKEKQIEGIAEDSVQSALLSAEEYAENGERVDTLIRNFNTLIQTLNINIGRLSHAANYDMSTVFRFRNGTRRPAEPEKFAAAVASYVAREHDTAQDKAVLSELLSADEKELSDISVCRERITEWLFSTQAPKEDQTNIFLTKLDEFDLNEYIQSIRFDELKVPTVPFQMPTSKAYFGLADMMESELDFLKATVLSKSMEPVIMYSDMPMKEMAKDPEFPKKWMFGMAMMLKKGLHLHQIHSLDRSFDDMMLGLEGWIPMYMTGQISPYYLKNVQNHVFLHFLKVSGAAALAGEAIAGHHEDGKYYLTKSKKEIEYYSLRAKELLSSAYPLMDIYRSERENEFRAFWAADVQISGRRRSVLSTLPLYTIEEDMLRSMLNNHGFPEEEAKRIAAYAKAQKSRIESILEKDCVEVEVPAADESAFDAHPYRLDLSDVFCERDVLYSYTYFSAHLLATERFAAQHPGFLLKKTASHTFRNLQIRINEGKCVVVSKGKAPAIHFVIHHPKLRSAIENFTPSIVEG